MYHRSPVAVERTLILIKPDAIERRLAGEILARFERRGFIASAASCCASASELGKQHYAEHGEKPFFGELVEFITSAPTLGARRRGRGRDQTCARRSARRIPPTRPGTIRGDFASSMPNNLTTAPIRPSRPSARSRSGSRDDGLV